MQKWQTVIFVTVNQNLAEHPVLITCCKLITGGITLAVLPMGR